MGQQQLLKKEQPHHHRSSTQHLSSISSKLQQRGWMQTIIDYRLELAKIANEMETLDESKTRQEEYKYQVRHYQNYTFDISPIYNVLRSAIDTVGVRGVIFDILNDEYDYFLYYPHSPQYDCFKSHGVGVDCTAFDTWWMYHFTGATIADHFLDSIRNGNRNNNEQEHDKRTGILWDGITNQRFTSMEGLIREIQKYQRLPYVNSASFHAQHAIIWQYLAQAYPDIQEYPSQLADTLCRSNADSGPRYARTVGKGIDHECYHGFGHAVFYVVAKRQMKLQQQQKRMIVNDPTVPSKNFPFPTTTPSISARLQVRPSSGFELTKEAMCQVYALCKGAIRSYDDKDKEDEYPYSKGVRVCLEGVVHSVRLFSDTRHNKKETVAYVMEEMHRCEKTTEKTGHRKKLGKTSSLKNDTSTSAEHSHFLLDSKRIRPPKEESDGLNDRR
ncbi:hypothetical protein IV203_030598 [Nitzschia inconspicua]|uniref:Uncharacterized protein n=1 Tax=Nitzschia inconspicua TaxID=303405 RepID=A0A9K3Q2C1_9STRA|nr:hypothetical protein IV203_017595 [Nitzschia inconspicua]KAG7367855.1 hypothetical protein IV203_030598 [Nitzschia inconspicua]